MRYLFLVSLGAAFLAALPASAAPRPGKAPPLSKADRELLRAEARKLGPQLAGILDQVAASYYRPVSREELLYAALSGLYQSARQPFEPRILRSRIKVAGSEPGITGVSANIPDPPAPPGEDGYSRLITQVREEVGQPEALRGQNPLLICCQSMAKILDPHSGIVTAEEQQRSIGLDQECEGFGLDVTDSGTGPVVVDVVQPGGPAQRAGLRPGDRITALDGKPVRSFHPLGALVLRNNRAPDNVPALAVPEDVAGRTPPAALPSTLEVTYTRPDKDGEVTVKVSRERFKPETVLGARRKNDGSWSYFLDEKKGIGYVRLTYLGRGTGEEMRQALTRLEDAGLRGLVLDLRWCPGGYLHEAVEVADLFVGEGVLATVQARGKEQSVYRSTDFGKFRKFPLVVLLNGETSGGGELIAAALQDHKRAMVAGQRSLGKASVQTPLSVGVPGVAFKLTSGTFIRPSGKNLHRFPDSKPADEWGVVPDAEGEFRLSADFSKQLKRWWLWQSLRPGSSLERLPLDDPRADPQQLQAVRLLEGLVQRQGKGG